MERYTYRFLWKKKDNTYIDKFIDAPSKEQAIKDFEKTFGVTVVEGKVAVQRMHM